MKKYLIPIIILGIVAAGIFLRYLIVSPARALALDLRAINGITVVLAPIAIITWSARISS
jgi:hypothetical protein